LEDFMKKAAIGLLALILAGVVAFAAASLTGTWEMSYTTQRGETKRDITFTQTGENLTVTWTQQPRGGQGDPIVIKGTGTVKGADILFTIVRQGRDGAEMKTEYKAKLVDDNNMAGSYEMNMGGNAQTIEWKAVRKPQ
jgi:hypothetical protein